jgi:hypothetical protein
MIEMSKKAIVVLGALASVATVYGFLVIILNLPLRPAWAWEMMQMNKAQQEFKLEYYQNTQRNINSQLYDNYRLQREYGDQTPEWVKKEEFDLKTQEKEIGHKIDVLEQSIINGLE